ncbi:hypothetical protein [Longimicrobium sp.]|jgi:uncharacterized membrane protein|uniref:hypothetical protein n=1 Tax=Longimicrobium sp. TaxID=2029185 RepID=UPI002F939760
MELTKARREVTRKKHLPEAAPAGDPGASLGAEAEPEELVQEIRAVIERYSGPLPHPFILAQYKEVEPRSIAWVLNSATKEQEHRQWCESEPLRQSGRAQWFAFVLAVLVVLVGGGLIYADKSAAGLATILVPLATLLGIFVYREIKSGRASDVAGEQRS